jgi:iron complex outermembrane receptor protein
VPAAAMAADAPVFTLGQVNASVPAASSTAIGGSTVSQDDMREFNRETVDRAMDLVPGASISNIGGRNERNIWVRGFDRWRVPLSIDGIRVYLPADNRVDSGLFTTNDIAEIQVTKGFTSVIDGPGAMGGSVNLVSRKVTRPQEVDIRLGAAFDNGGAFNGFVTDAFGGMRFSDWYLQGSVTENLRTHYSLSDDYVPTSLENGGKRDHSYRENFKLNLKAGYQPTPFDEYSLNFINQNGAKDNAFPDIPGAQARNWSWPSWDKQSLYWISKTGLDDKGSYIKVKTFVDRFYNALYTWDNADFNSQSTTNASRSFYEDYAFGGTVEGSQELFAGRDTLKAALHYRHDIHSEWNDYFKRIGAAGVTTPDSEPHQRDREETWSGAIENTFRPIETVELTPGVSYDYRHLIKAEDFSTNNNGGGANVNGQMIAYPRRDDHAINPQLAAAWRYDEAGSVHASLSRRTRFPTLFERFSNRFGSFTGNATLKAEKSNNFETGVTQTIGHTKLGVNLFQSWLENAIQSVSLTATTSQNQNVGKAIHKGFELEISHVFGPELEVGANYSNLLRTVPDKSFVLTDTPRHKAFAYANWKPLDGLSVVPSVEIGGNRRLSRAVSSGSSTLYFDGGNYAIANLKAGYRFSEVVQLEAGINNLFDTNYKIVDGYHEEGRNFFSNVRITF